MKRLAPLFLTLLMLLCSCEPAANTMASPSLPSSEETSGLITPTEENPNPSAEVTTEEDSSPEVLPIPDGNEGLPVTEKNDGFDSIRKKLPTMDGSTSMIPYEAAMRALLFDISYDEALNYVSHTTTWGAFQRLVEGSCDLIFSCPISEEQRKLARENNVELVEIPVAMEAFVFVVNADNPVDTLTQKQIRDIYSGKITNWKEVGGNDAPIIAYQRNNDSGSQNFMIDFMKNHHLMDAPTEFRPATMSGLIDVIAFNDNSVNSIGYSVYAYAADMYQNSEKIKFIKVDGIEPTHASINDKSYPLLGYNYIIHVKDGKNQENIQLFVDFALSEEAQLAAAKARYVPVSDVEFDFASMLPKPYTGVGTGKTKGSEKDWNFFYAQDRTYKITREYLLDGEKVYLSKVQGLQNKKLEQEINAFIDDSVAELLEYYPSFKRKTETFAEQWSLYYTSQRLNTAITERNGYLSVAVYYSYEPSPSDDSYTASYRSKTAVWDLVSGKKLSLEEMFCDGIDIAGVLNHFVERSSILPYDTWGSTYSMKRDFASLEADADWWHVTLDKLYIDENNPYFSTGVVLNLGERELRNAVWKAERDNRSCFDDSVSKPLRYLFPEGSTHVTGLFPESYNYPQLDEDMYPHAKKINEQITAYLKTYFDGWENELLRRWDETLIGYRYFVVQNIDAFTRDPNYRTLVFDLETGEEIPWEKMLKPDWMDSLSQEEREQLEGTDFILHRVFPCYFYEYDPDNHIKIRFFDKNAPDNIVDVTISPDQLNLE